MKKIITALFIILAISLLFGCADTNTQVRTTVNFYYKTNPIDHISENGIITIEPRSVRTNALDYQILLEQYLEGAQSGNCISPFPAGTTLKSFSLNETSVSITLSPHLTMLSNADLTIACICIARTIFDLTGVDSVQISAQNNLINGQPDITITKSSIVMEDVVTSIGS